MSKSRFLKFILAISILTILMVGLMVGTVSAESVKISYKYGDYVRDISIEANSSFVPIDVTLDDGVLYFGWVDGNGKLYPKGQNATVSKDTELHIVYGSAVSSESEFLSAVERGETYIVLASNVSLYSPLALDNGVLVIDTNGKTLTINSETNAIDGKGSGIVFTGGGMVKHNYMGSTPEFTMDSFIKLSPTSSMSTLFVNVCENTSIESPVDFISFATNIDRFDGVFNADIYGSITCNRLMHTQGISGASFTIHENATVTTGCEFLFEDISSTTASRLVNFTVYGGTFNLKRLHGYAKDYSKYQAAILGGTFSENVTNCFPDKNYEFKYNATTEFFDFQKCNHYGPIISGMPETCTTPNVVLTYKCQYCNTIYEDSKSFVSGIGHFYVTETVQPLIANEYITQEGITKTYCKRCGDVSETKVTYPDPTQVYVNVVYLDEIDNKQKTLRVPSDAIFDFDTNNKTYLKYFITAYISNEYGISRKNILSVEIPLGTTKIYGSEYTHSGTGEKIPIGVFYDNTHLTEVVIPPSVAIIEKNAFREMHKLTSIKGLENIAGSISSYAFFQTHTNVLIDQLVLNASRVGEFAFNNIRMNSLTIGANLKTIDAGAFRLEVDEEKGITSVKEVFVEGNTLNKVSVTKAMNSRGNGSSCVSTSQQFGTDAVVYTEHQCDIEITEPTCKAMGYTTHTCKYCSYVLIDTFTATLEHKPVLHQEPATCTTPPHEYMRCPNCLEIEPGSYMETGIRNQNHSFTTNTCYIFLDESGHMAHYQSFETPCIKLDNKNKGFYDENNNKLSGKDYYICEDKYAKVLSCDRCGMPKWEDSPTDASKWTSPSSKGHSADTDNMEIKIEPTCGDQGLAEAPCLICSKIVDVILLPADKSHVYGDPVVITPPTCVSEGVQEFRCKNCSTEVKTGKIDKLKADDPASHAFDEGKVIREATEDTTGIKLYTCTRPGCNATRQEGISLLSPANEGGLPTGILILLIVGGVLLAGGVVLTLYFTLFKKKKASANYTYKFNTLGK